jgi:hypothetical protein
MEFRKTETREVGDSNHHPCAFARDAHIWKQSNESKNCICGIKIAASHQKHKTVITCVIATT